jgi:hypothetical protein
VTGSRSRFIFEGLEPIEQRFLARAGHGAYIALKDRTDRKHEEGVGRVDLDAAQLAEFLTDTDDDELGFGGALADDEPSEPWYDEDEPKGNEDHSPEQLMRAALRWVRATAIRNTSGDAKRHFRVRLFGPKGYSALDGGHFDCLDRTVDEQDDEPLPEIPPPDPRFAQSASMSKGLGALGEFYAQWGRIVLGSVGQIQGVNNNLLEKLHKQLQDARDQNDQLIAAILEARVAEIESKETRAATEHEGDARHALAKEALGQLGAAANTFLASKGMSPEMIDIFGQLGGSPDLIAALKDPKVRALMQDPDNLKGLAEMLKQAGVQAQAAQQPPSNETPNPESAAS